MLRKNSLWPTLRMILGSILGIIGFGTLSMGFVGLNPSRMAFGVAEILLGVFISLGVMSPLRKRHSGSIHEAP